MSVERPRSEFFTRLPFRFWDAWRAGELDLRHVGLGYYLATRCFEAGNTTGGVAAVRLSELVEVCEASDDTARRKLHDLRDAGWIDFEVPRRGPGSTWRIRLAGLTVSDHDAAGFPTNNRTITARDPLSVRQSITASESYPHPAIPHEQRVEALSELPPSRARAKRNETKRNDTRVTPGSNGVNCVTDTSRAREFARPLVGDVGYPEQLAASFGAGLITAGERSEGERAHRFVVACLGESGRSAP